MNPSTVSPFGSLLADLAACGARAQPRAVARRARALRRATPAAFSGGPGARSSSRVRRRERGPPASGPFLALGFPALALHAAGLVAIVILPVLHGRRAALAGSRGGGRSSWCLTVDGAATASRAAREPASAERRLRERRLRVHWRTAASPPRRWPRAEIKPDEVIDPAPSVHPRDAIADEGVPGGIEEGVPGGIVGGVDRTRVPWERIVSPFLAVRVGGEDQGAAEAQERRARLSVRGRPRHGRRAS